MKINLGFDDHNNMTLYDTDSSQTPLLYEDDINLARQFNRNRYKTEVLSMAKDFNERKEFLQILESEENKREEIELKKQEVALKKLEIQSNNDIVTNILTNIFTSFIKH